MSRITSGKLRNSKRRIANRLGARGCRARDEPMLSASNIHYEISDRVRGLAGGGIGAIHKMVSSMGLVNDINEEVKVLKVHLPYHESDHVLSIAYNLMMGGTCLEDIERLRNDEVYLNALEAKRIPDPTTAGDFCRRFDWADVEDLMDAINQTRLRVWAQQPDAFFEEAIIDADGTLAETTGECKEGMDISYKGTWGFHPLVVSLANTSEPLYLVNRSGNRPSSEGASEWLDDSIALCRRAGFRKITLRGDTDFTQTRHLDRWDEKGVKFVFGIAAMGNLVEAAEDLSRRAWKRLVRRSRYEDQTEPRARPENVKERIVVEREYKNIRLRSEDVAEFEYSPTKCKKTYRVVSVRKNLSVERGDKVLFDDVRYFFYITNDKVSPVEQIVFEANDRCNQENLIAQLKSGVQALRMPVDNLVSNWAYMVMASLAWTLKAWFALLLPETGRWAEKHAAEKKKVLRMDFRTFVNAFIRIPVQIVRQGRKVIYRVLSWNPWLHVFFRGWDRVRYPMRC